MSLEKVKSGREVNRSEKEVSSIAAVFALPVWIDVAPRSKAKWSVAQRSFA